MSGRFKRTRDPTPAYRLTKRRLNPARRTTNFAYRMARMQRYGSIIQRGPAVQHSAKILKSCDVGGPQSRSLDSRTVVAVAQVLGAGGAGAGGWPITGAGIFNRIGNRITLKSLHIVGLLKQTGTATGLQEYIRIMVVYDKMPNGTVPVAGDILGDQDSTGAITTNSWSNMRIDNRDRFKILMDDRIGVVNNAATGLQSGEAMVIDYKGEININRFIKLNDMETMFKASTNGQLSDVAVGNLWLFCLGNIAAGSEGYSLVYNARLRYHDC
ncbi:MAG: capsid protein [Circoviridae sp.]|nr:MAG: capsid protein [Circoviridae sp.]